MPWDDATWTDQIVMVAALLVWILLLPFLAVWLAAKYVVSIFTGR